MNKKAFIAMSGGVDSSVAALLMQEQGYTCTGEEAAQCRGCLEARVRMAGYEIVTDRGDVARKVI